MMHYVMKSKVCSSTIASSRVMSRENDQIQTRKSSRTCAKYTNSKWEKSNLSRRRWQSQKIDMRRSAKSFKIIKSQWTRWCITSWSRNLAIAIASSTFILSEIFAMLYLECDWFVWFVRLDRAIIEKMKKKLITFCRIVENRLCDIYEISFVIVFLKIFDCWSQFEIL